MGEGIKWKVSEGKVQIKVMTTNPIPQILMPSM